MTETVITEAIKVQAVAALKELIAQPSAQSTSGPGAPFGLNSPSVRPDDGVMSPAGVSGLMLIQMGTWLRRKLVNKGRFFVSLGTWTRSRQEI